MVSSLSSLGPWETYPRDCLWADDTGWRAQSAECFVLLGCLLRGREGITVLILLCGQAPLGKTSWHFGNVDLGLSVLKERRESQLANPVHFP